MLRRVVTATGRRLAHYLNQPIRHYQSFDSGDPQRLAAVLQPADVLLVDGNSRVSTAIKYLTQSTWSHAALFVGDYTGSGLEATAARVLIEADLEEGVIAVPLARYAHLNTRICRASGLSEAGREQVCRYLIERLGHAYDLKNVIDLARYLVPTPPVPVRWRRRMLALGSGDPTRAICSTLLAQAFQSVRYPILPQIEHLEIAGGQAGHQVREILHIRHYSLFVPRDFDISPYFEIIKPALEDGFDYRSLTWADQLEAERQDRA